MKTINVPLVGKCPDWDDSIPAHRLGDFQGLLADVHQFVLNLAARKLVGDETPRHWHRYLFAQFVPLAYYAGNFRQADPSRPCLSQNVHVLGAYGWPYQTTPQAMNALFQNIRRQITGLELRWAEMTPQRRATELAGTIANLVGGFVQVHPFINGNGRISRLLWRWALLRFGVPIQCTTFPRPGPPYGQIMGDAMRGDYVPLMHAVLVHLAHHPPHVA